MILGQADGSDSLLTRYSQELDTRVWRLQGQLNRQEQDWSVRGLGSSEITNRNLPGFKPQWKNEFVLRLNAEHRFNRDLSLVIESAGQEYQDRAARFIVERGSVSNLPNREDVHQVSESLRSGDDTRITRGSVRSGVKWQAGPVFEVHLLGGGAFDQQTQGEGAGPSGRGGFSYAPEWDNPFKMEGDGWIDQYGERRNHEAILAMRTRQPFGDATDILDLRWINRRNDLFLGTTGNVVRRLNDELQLANSLVSPVGNDMIGSYDIRFRNTNVDYDQGDIGAGRELDFVNRFALQGEHGDYFGMASYSYGVEDRTYGGSLILGRRQIIQLSGGWSSDGDSVLFSYNAQKLAFNSPDSLETSDRDRLIHSIRHQSIFYLLSDTRLVVDALVVLDHLVNISSVRSADNRWNRVFRLNPAIQWIPGSGWRNTTDFEVLANYNVYDFEDAVASTSLRSNALRRWSASDTLIIPLMPNWSAEIASRYDLEDRGRLRWDEFVQELSDEAQAYYGSLALQRTIWTRATLTLGYRLQHRIEDRLDRNADGSTRRSQARDYRAHGPMVRVTTTRNRNLQLNMNASFLTVDDSAQDETTRHDSIFLTLLYNW
ncbi:hypothetical protein KQI63_01945 [bacterium]|nr:hypothetical protein [bacterium]